MAVFVDVLNAAAGQAVVAVHRLRDQGRATDRGGPGHAHETGAAVAHPQAAVAVGQHRGAAAGQAGRPAAGLARPLQPQLAPGLQHPAPAVRADGEVGHAVHRGLVLEARCPGRAAVPAVALAFQPDRPVGVLQQAEGRAGRAVDRVGGGRPASAVQREQPARGGRPGLPLRAGQQREDRADGQAAVPVVPAMRGARAFLRRGQAHDASQRETHPQRAIARHREGADVLRLPRSVALRKQVDALELHAVEAEQAAGGAQPQKPVRCFGDGLDVRRRAVPREPGDVVELAQLQLGRQRPRWRGWQQGGQQQGPSRTRDEPLHGVQGVPGGAQGLHGVKAGSGRVAARW